MRFKTKTAVYTEKELTRKAPANLREEDRALFQKELKSTLPAVAVLEYENVCVSPEGIVFRGLSLQKELLIYPKHQSTYNSLYLFSTLLKRKKIKPAKGEMYLLIFDYWSNSVFHWMADALPRLASIKQAAKDFILLLPENYNYPYIHDSLKAFDIKGIFKLPVNTYVQCPRLIVPEHVTVSGAIRPENILEVRKTILSYYAADLKKSVHTPNIYVSRSKALYRKVLNEEALLPILHKYNFKVVFFEDMSFAEQVACCYQAKNVVSIHGANLTNTVFMQAGGNVLEFRKEKDADNHYFYAIADSVGCNYYYQTCEAVDKKPGYNFFDLTVDAQLFETNLKLMLQQ
jgi:hypothetical protein